MSAGIIEIDFCGLTIERCEGAFGVLPTCYHHATKIGNAPTFCEMQPAFTFSNQINQVSGFTFVFLGADFAEGKLDGSLCGEPSC